MSLVMTPTSALAETEPLIAEEQSEAARQILEELEEATTSQAVSSIEGVDAIGPVPWLSFSEQNEDTAEAWLEIAKQLPANELSANTSSTKQSYLQQLRTGKNKTVTVEERELQGELGINDTPAQAEKIRKFGTWRKGARVAELSGNLSGGVDRNPIDFDCPSVEEDGSIPEANEILGDFALCGGEIGDGPAAETSGDVDFYSFGQIEKGSVIVLDVVQLSDPLDPVAATVGIYSSSGELVASMQDDGSPLENKFLEYSAEEDDTYYGAIAGGLPTDPFDPESGTDTTKTGTYEFFASVAAPPCLSVEDDGNITEANDASNVEDGAIRFVLCSGEVGNGPFADSSGDVDFFQTAEIEAGRVLLVDLGIVTGEEEQSGDLTIGVYDNQGTLLASGNDSPAVNNTDYFSVKIPATGSYYVALSGALPADPFDSESGADTEIVSPYSAYFVDLTPELLEEITNSIDEEPGDIEEENIPEAPEWKATSISREDRQEERKEEIADDLEEIPELDVDFYKVYLRKGDAISGGFDSAREVGIVGPDETLLMSSPFNPSFIYPPESPLRHNRRVGMDHVASERGLYYVYVTDGNGPYEGELRVTRSGLADEYSDAQQVIFVDFDGASVDPSIYDPFASSPAEEVALSPLADFIEKWGLDASDEDAIIDGVLDILHENLDEDLRIKDGRNGNRDETGLPTRFDVEILNSRDHQDPWGQPNVSRLIIGGTIEELGIQTIGIAESIDPGNTDTTETGVILLDLLSSDVADDPISLNSYEIAEGSTKVDLVSEALGNITAHEAGHYFGNWHTETFNEKKSLMDAGGEFNSVFGVGEDSIYGSNDDVDLAFSTDAFNVFEGFIGTEDTSARSVFALSTGRAWTTNCWYGSHCKQSQKSSKNTHGHKH